MRETRLADIVERRYKILIKGWNSDSGMSRGVAARLSRDDCAKIRKVTLLPPHFPPGPAMMHEG